ncbi:MAG: hypothetical protein AAF613_09630 [Pseudomonadota bacterium]
MKVSEMASKEELIGQATDLWDLFVVEVKALGDDLYYWVTHLSDEERTIGICIFIVVLMFMIFSRRVKKNTDPGTSRSFTGAFFLVVIFAFGAGWSMDHSAGSLSHLFKR